MVCFAHPRPDCQAALIISAVVFALGFLLFIGRFMGGGDIKLLTAAALWAGKNSALDFFVWVGFLGGLLAIGLWLIRFIIPALFARLKIATIPRVLTIGEPAPYGVAIAIAFLLILLNGKIAGLPL